MKKTIMLRDHFEVKTGKNKGFYLVSKGGYKVAFKASLPSNWGWIGYEDQPSFFKRHGVSQKDLIWTQPKFAGSSIREKAYREAIVFTLREVKSI